MNGFHRLNTTPLVMGTLLIGLAVAWGARQLGWIDDYPLTAATLLVISGAVGIIAFLTRRPELPAPDTYQISDTTTEENNR